MPETKVESIIFTAVTAWIMVYIMTLYNTVIAGEDFVNATFLVALRGMWLEFVLIFLCAYFISGPAARRLTFRIVKSEDRPIVIIVTMQIFTVVFQVALASILGVYYSYGLTEQLIPDYIMTYCRNFIMALPVQLFLAGPARERCSAGCFGGLAVRCSAVLPRVRQRTTGTESKCGRSRRTKRRSFSNEKIQLRGPVI